MSGVYSHGLNRFPRVVEYLKKGAIEHGGHVLPMGYWKGSGISIVLDRIVTEIVEDIKHSVPETERRRSVLSRRELLKEYEREPKKRHSCCRREVESGIGNVAGI